jgi:flavin reductase (DIM6/NTAB) family NADH-FMN oxidoreductase RutF/rubredoxin
MKYRAFHKMSYGLYIVATRHNDENAGYIGNTVFQVTSDPAQIAISCHKKNSSVDKILESKIFSVSVLGKHADTSLIGQFGFMSGSDVDKFRNLEIKTAATGAPVILDSAIAWFDCKVVSTLDVGSHLLIIGEVLDSDVISDEEPLTYAYYREKYKMLSPKNAPTYIEKEKLDKEKPVDKSESPAPAEAEQKGSASEKNMDIYTCTICGYQYDPEEGEPLSGIPPGIPFADLPEDYKCPVCNAGKEYFRREY